MKTSILNASRALSFALFSLIQIHTQAAAVRVPDSEEHAVIPLQENESGRAVYLRTMRAKYDTPFSKIGELQSGWFCGNQKDIMWSPPLFSSFSNRLAKTLRRELEIARYPVPQQASDSMFDDPSKEKPKALELHVGMMIKEINANYCLKPEGLQGEAYMKIFWQVYAPEAKKILFETTTSGTFRQESVKKMDAASLYDQAFAMASRNLLAQQGFHDAVVNLNLPVAPVADVPQIMIKSSHPSTEPLAKNITNLRSAVVTIKADTGSGSGFFISADGYVLSNQHVVGNARFVKVILPTGRELVGEVIRQDKDRDVALIKTEAISVQPVSLRSDDANIGEDVYAIGSPLGEKFNTTLTRGILSGYRTLAEKRFIQSDVAILPGDSGGPLFDPKGNVIGITVAGLGARGIAGMNFFIPIQDATSKLRLNVSN